MQLKLKRTQKETGVLSKTIMFCLDARVELSPDEANNLNRYKLGNLVVYNSQASQKYLASANNAYDGSAVGSLKSIGILALAAMQLNITIVGLSQGQHIECKSLDELMGAEDAVRAACQNIRNYLDLAATFDGREAVVTYEPAVL